MTEFVSRLHKSGIKIQTYKRLYPQGDPRMVYEGVTGRGPPARVLARGSERPGGLSLRPSWTSYNAIVWNRPVTERVITISGAGY
jgi:Na+-translocating ferredoxin:NAD+ oxidoreductase RnfC subunit